MQWHRGVEGAVADFDWQDWRYKQFQQRLRPSPESSDLGLSVTGPSVHDSDNLATEDEYSNVVRVYSDIRVPDGYKHVDAGEALFVVQYAREMTLARGRILYEVWDRWMNCSFGYLVPSHIHSEAISYRTTFDAWNSLRFHDRTIREHAHKLIMDQFPRINPTSAKIIAEKMIIEKRQVTPRNVEQNVINHLRHCWSSYELRLSRKDGEGKYSPRKDVLEAIKPRMRGMMQKWLAQDINGTRLAMLWRRHHLLDEEKSHGPCKEGDVFHRPTALTWYGGKETVGNLVNTERAYL